jgi:hypothetical protein
MIIGLAGAIALLHGYEIESQLFMILGASLLVWSLEGARRAPS